MQSDNEPLRVREWDVVMYVEGVILLATCAGVSLTSGVPALLSSVFLSVGISVFLLGAHLSVKTFAVPTKIVHDVLCVLRRAAQRVMLLTWLVVATFFVMWSVSVTTSNLFVDMMTLPTGDIDSVWYGWSHSVTVFWTISLLFVCLIATICLAQVGTLDSARLATSLEHARGRRLLRSLRTYSGLLSVVVWFWLDREIVIRDVVCLDEQKQNNCSLDAYFTLLRTDNATEFEPNPKESAIMNLGWSWASTRGCLALLLGVMASDVLILVADKLIMQGRLLFVAEALACLCALAAPAVFVITFYLRKRENDTTWASTVCYFWLVSFFVSSVVALLLLYLIPNKHNNKVTPEPASLPQTPAADTIPKSHDSNAIVGKASRYVGTIQRKMGPTWTPHHSSFSQEEVNHSTMHSPFTNTVNYGYLPEYMFKPPARYAADSTQKKDR